MRAPRPLQVPGHVGFPGCLGALLRDIAHPARIRFQAVECVGLKNAEGNEGGKSTGD